MGLYAVYAALGYVLAFSLGQTIIQAKQRANKVQSKESPARYLLSIVSVSLLPFAIISLQEQQVNPWLVTLGCIIAATGALFSWWAQWELGRNWVAGVALRKGHRLITSGPYRYVRHPMYAGILFSSAGLGICSLSPGFFFAMLTFAGSVAIRCPMEDLLLRKKFPKEYPAYAAATGALFPKIKRHAS